MRRLYYRRLLYSVPLVLLQRCLDLTSKYDRTPDELLLNAVAGKVTSDAVTSFVLAAESIIFLLLFLILFGDYISQQQRTGAVYLFSRMPSRRPWFIRQLFTLGGCAYAYCGIYVFLHTLISLLSSKVNASMRTYMVALALWAVFSLIAWGFAVGCSLLCGKFGSSVGVMLCALVIIVLAAVSAKSEVPRWMLAIDPAYFPEEVFSDADQLGLKVGILCAELLAITLAAGRYFDAKDIFAAEGDG